MHNTFNKYARDPCNNIIICICISIRRLCIIITMRGLTSPLYVLYTGMDIVSQPYQRVNSCAVALRPHSQYSRADEESRYGEKSVRTRRAK